MNRLLIVFLFISTISKAQQYYTISGTITDAANGEQLVNAVIQDENTKKAAQSNFYGYYSFSLPQGNVKLFLSYVGYKHEIKEFNLNADTSINIQLTALNNTLSEVVVTAPQVQGITAQPGVLSLKIAQVKSTPALLGESDLLKTLQLTPGVKSGTEGTGGLYVRGGGPDQNLILLDGVPVYNSSHLFGFFSVFNPDALSGFTFYKGGIPARYAGRLSSVLDIKMKEGNNQKISGEGSLGFITSKFTIEGPIGSKTSFIASGRRTFIDVFTRPMSKIYNGESPNYYFYDFNGKINHQINNKNKIYLSIYTGRDYAGSKYKSSSPDYETKFKATNGFGWGNLTVSSRWNYLITNKLFSNFTAIYSRYLFKIEEKLEETYDPDGNLDNYLNRYTSGITDLGARYDLEYYTEKGHNLRFGASYTHHNFNPGIKILKNDVDSINNSIDTTFGNKKTPVHDLYFYAEDEFITGPVTINAGLNYSIFSVQGRNYSHLQPRLAVQVKLTQRLNAKLSYNQLSQFLHLLTNTTIGMPTDLWLPATKKAAPQKAVQYSTGLYYNLPVYSFCLEGYFKEMKNLIEYKEGASFYQIDESWEDKIETGRGKSYGLEFMAQKHQGRLTGWFGTTLSKTTRKFAAINNGLEFPFKFDSRWDVSVVAQYKISDRVSLNANWVYHSGNAVTLAISKVHRYTGYPDQKFHADMDYENWLPNYTTRNNFRTPDYHRLDAGLDFSKPKKHVVRIWSVGIYNLYNRKNPFFIYADLDEKKPKIKQLSLFPVLPYARFTIKF